MKTLQPTEDQQVKKAKPFNLFVFFREQEFKMAIKDHNLGLARRHHEKLKEFRLSQKPTDLDIIRIDDILARQEIILEEESAGLNRGRKKYPN